MLKKIFHGKGVDAYKSKKAKEEFARGLIKLGDHCFILMLAPLAGYFVNPSKINLSLLILALVAFFAMGAKFRHEGLEIIDELENAEADPKSH